MEDPIMDDAHDDDYDQLLRDIFDSSDEEEPAVHGGSRPGRAGNVDRQHSEGHARLVRDYFSDAPTYDDTTFARRFRVSWHIFLEIVRAVCEIDTYFVQKTNCAGVRGLSALQKCTAAMRMLAYGGAADVLDEYMRMAESTSLEALMRFCRAVVQKYGDAYLRPPTKDEVIVLLRRGAYLGFPGMLGSIDCCKWRWKNCPTALHGQYQGKEGVPTVTLEAIADDRLYIWHMFFGMSGCNNDINVVEASTLCNKIASGEYPPANPVTNKEKLMSRMQESRRKDSERAFGVLQGKFHIVSRPSRFWYKDDMHAVMNTCVILHNMMVNEREGLEEGIGRACVSGGNRMAASVRVGEEGMQHAFMRDASGATPPPLGSIAALCRLCTFLGDAAQYQRTRELVMKHLWLAEGSRVREELDPDVLFQRPIALLLCLDGFFLQLQLLRRRDALLQFLFGLASPNGPFLLRHRRLDLLIIDGVPAALARGTYPPSPARVLSFDSTSEPNFGCVFNSFQHSRKRKRGPAIVRDGRHLDAVEQRRCHLQNVVHVRPSRLRALDPHDAGREPDAKLVDQRDALSDGLRSSHFTVVRPVLLVVRDGDMSVEVVPLLLGADDGVLRDVQPGLREADVLELTEVRAPRRLLLLNAGFLDQMCDASVMMRRGGRCAGAVRVRRVRVGGRRVRGGRSAGEVRGWAGCIGVRRDSAGIALPWCASDRFGNLA
eukprot:IDg7479t1